MAQNDMMAPEFRRLLKADGHLGALYDPKRNILRVVCKQGTVDYDLTQIAKETRREVAYVTQEQP